MNAINRMPRGSMLVVVLVFVGILLAATVGFASFVQRNDNAMEYDIASAHALELSEGAAMKTVSTLWRDFSQVPSSNPQDKIYYVAFCNSDTGRTRTVTGTPQVKTATYNYDWTAFGGNGDPTSCAREVKVSSDVYNKDISTFTWADVVITASARVRPATLNTTDKRTWIYRSVKIIVRFSFTDQSRVFDFAYFANNFGWQYDSGSTIRIFGNMGANGDCSFQGSPYVDGYVFAAANPAIGAQGVVNGASCIKHDTLPQYRSYVAASSAGQKTLMPVTNPAYTEDLNANSKLDTGEDKNGNGKVDSIPYAAGYDGNCVVNAKQTPLDMPYLGDLSIYKGMATAAGGKIEQLKAGVLAAGETLASVQTTNPSRYAQIQSDSANWDTVVNAVYGSNSTDNGVYSTQDGAGNVTRTAVDTTKKLSTTKQEANGNLALIGTGVQPIRITGPVVVTNDVVIKGVITGQGTLYTGRNLNIVGDLTYANPPTTAQNDINFTADLAVNNTKDMIGFATKGSVILGQYYHLSRTSGDQGTTTGMYDNGDAWNSAASYFKTGFQNSKAQAYQTDPTDQAIGYYNPTTKSFAGDYTANDGGVRYSNTALSATTTRKYYESSFSDHYIQSIATQPPSKIQGLFYTNHLFGGRPNNLALFGSMVSRDEGIVFTGYAYFMYDSRSSSASAGSRVKIPNPGAPACHVWTWEEVAPPVN